MPVKFIIILLFLALPFTAAAQVCTVTGRVIDEKNTPIESAEVNIHQQNTEAQSVITDSTGAFKIKVPHPGAWLIAVMAHGYKSYSSDITISNTQTDLGQVKLHLIAYVLDEIRVVQKIRAVEQKDDTLEFNSGAFKVNPDADAADLIRKMPSMDIDGQNITSQGEAVTKIVVDGRPFFSNDPYGSLKNLPADIIDKVQVYNEKSDQEKFTGFSEGSTTKTINIITKADKRNGAFGSAYAGGGSDNSSDGRYGTGTTLNQFGGDRRITVTAQSNDINAQSFTEPKSAPAGNIGLTNTNAIGINYTDKLGAKAEVSGNYQFSTIKNTTTSDLRKTYILDQDSGQVYNESDLTNSKTYSHRLSLNIDYTIDSVNSVLMQPALSLNTNNSTSFHNGNTEENSEPLNQTLNNITSSRSALSFNNTLLFRHRFHKYGRTFSVNVNTSSNGNNGIIIRTAQNEYFTNTALNDTLNQKGNHRMNIWNVAGNATYTEPAGKNGEMKVDYTFTYQPEGSRKNTADYDVATAAYTIPDSLLSNTFFSTTIEHNTGISYMYHHKSYELSVGINYQLTGFGTDQAYPTSYTLSRQYSNVLPVASFRYKISKTKNLQLTYSTHTQVPSINQLQNVLNNTDPLHLYIGNPSLQQPYQHSITTRYSSVSKKAGSSFSAALTGSITQHYITTNSIITQSDTFVNISQRISLPKGSQLTTPVNINDNTSVNGNVSYGIPLTAIKCHLNVNVNASLSHTPSIINSIVNYQNNKNGSAAVSLNSNISENVDFTVSSNTSVVASENSINKLLNTTYVNETDRLLLNLIVLKSIVFNVGLSYQYYSGLSTGFNNDYLLWNMSIGKKIFKNHQGDIRLSFFDILNQNSNITHIVSDTYIQDSRSDILQRYFLLVFTYKIRHFKSSGL